MSHLNHAPNPYLLYLVTDDKQDLDTLVNVVRQAVAGGVTMVQVREKHGDVREFMARAFAVKKALEGTHVPLIINDRVDVALAVDADGVHLGQTDMPAAVARQLIGNEKLLGLSIENHQQLQECANLPIDYIGLSAIYPTATKTDTQTYWGLNGLRYALDHCTLPIVAIGGIDSSNVPSICETGVDGLAIVSAISHAKDPQKAAHDLRQLIAQHHGKR
ncbi:thiamine phosphate synthase [Vibrio sp. SM6]|uniref:Thiamine-phosphate synthase n=1 Tax=Vibrio agarilyticus TaxID=2726741 RepID=A0A7X8TP23_9VIBR|nr:thiamine phosphate synthase [Vibrio agarilyticus]NLS12047.1 thiamine phosphate synthase [Vibrio agarilyticus]